MNLLGDKVETPNNPELNSEGKVKLIGDALKRIENIKQIARRAGKRLMLSTDSMKFIDTVKEKFSNVYIVPGRVKHIDTVASTDDEENIKLFLDMYLMAYSDKVYSLVGPGMWPSAFPEYSANIGQVKFERIKWDD